jgi:hypothetical protein
VAALLEYAFIINRIYASKIEVLQEEANEEEEASAKTNLKVLCPSNAYKIKHAPLIAQCTYNCKHGKSKLA